MEREKIINDLYDMLRRTDPKDRKTRQLKIANNVYDRLVINGVIRDPDRLKEIN